MYIPFYTKSNYSLLSSLLTLDDMIYQAKKNHQTVCVLCDHTMYGVMEFIEKCKKQNLEPIIGLEVNIGYKVLCYAKNFKGYQALMKLFTLSCDQMVQLDDILPLKENILIILPFESKDEYLHLSENMQVYLGYQNLLQEKEALQITDQIVFLRENLYLTAKDSEDLSYLYMIRDGKTISQLEEVDYDIYNHSLEIKDVLSLSHNEGLLKTFEIAEQCKIVFPKVELELAVYPLQHGQDAKTYLEELSKKGLWKRLQGHVPKNYETRLLYELSIIQKMGFANYFLVVYDFIRYAKKEGILVGPGRGSAAGSLVAYALGITEIDPIHYHLIFERFLNPERITMPDIDTDFPDQYRNQVIEYVKEKYGAKQVAGIVTFGTLGAKQVLRDVARVLSIPSYKVDSLSHYIPAFTKEKLKDFYETNPSFKEMIDQDESLKRLYQLSLKFEGFPRHTSSHAAGIVMARRPLDEIVPLTKSDGFYLTAYPMEYLENLGLLKMDFLGLRNLTLIMHILEDILKHTGKQIDFSKIPLDDTATIDIFKNADTTGIFQFESTGMRQFLKNLRPTCFEDIFAAIALFRPGPAQNIPSYIRRKHKEEKITYLDPSLEPILKNTYGILIYQEQIMQVASVYAGYSLGEADILRRAMSKKKKDLLKNEEEHFLKGAQAKGHSIEQAKEIFALILNFAGYGFNRSHSVAYSLIAYKMAYLKCHYPNEFYCNILSNVIGSDMKLKEYMTEAKAKGLEIVRPDMNHSGDLFLLDQQKIYFPFSSIRGIGTVVCKQILEARKEGLFQNVFDTISRLVLAKVTRKQIETLVEAGAFDSFGYTRRTLIEEMDALINYGELTKDLDPSFVLLPELTKKEEYSNSELLEKEFSLFGFYLSSHPTLKYQKEISGTVPLNQLDQHFNQPVKVLVLIEKIKIIKTKKGDKMAFLLGSDETAMVDFTCFPKVYEKYLQLKKGDIAVLTGMVEKRYNQLQMIVNAIEIKGGV